MANNLPLYRQGKLLILQNRFANAVILISSGFKKTVCLNFETSSNCQAFAKFLEIIYLNHFMVDIIEDFGLFQQFKSTWR